MTLRRVCTGKNVPMAKDCIGSDVDALVNGLADGEVLPNPRMVFAFCCRGFSAPSAAMQQDTSAHLSYARANTQCCLLENVRFYPEEEKNDKAFSKKLAAPFDMYVNDAFGTAHRYFIIARARSCMAGSA